MQTRVCKSGGYGRRHRRRLLVSGAVGICLVSTLAAAQARQGDPAHNPALPVVFVHGGAGSAAQYETQAMRWASNGYPNRVTAIDRTSSEGEEIRQQLDGFFDQVMASTGDTQLYVIGHSLGVAIMNDYLNSSQARTARVAKYIGIDSASAGPVETCPGIPTPIPCKGIYRRDNADLHLGENNVYLDNHGHTQAVTSEASFVEQYRFFTGYAPATTLVLPEPPDQVDIAGRIINFPANTGLEGATLRLWKLAGTSGQRVDDAPLSEITLDSTGEWGPIPVEGGAYYEFETTRPDVDYVGHAYYEPFVRDDHLIRLLATPPDAATVANTTKGPHHGAVVVIRYKEWWADQGDASDALWVLGEGVAAAADLDPAQVAGVPLLANPEVAPRASSVISLHVHDTEADQHSALTPIPFFASQAFQTGVDVFLPAQTPPDRTLHFTSMARDALGETQVIGVPNWASDQHRVGVQFNDYAQSIRSFAQCQAAGLCPCAEPRTP